MISKSLQIFGNLMATSKYSMDDRRNQNENQKFWTNENENT